MRPNIKKHALEYAAIFLLAVFSGFLVSFCNLSVLFIIASILFAAVSFRYFNQALYFLILYIPFQIALNITSGIDLASGRVFILYLFAVWIIKSLAEKKFVIRLNLQTLLILLFLSIACFSILGAWDIERASRKVLVFLSIFPLYFVITSLPLPYLSKEGLGVVMNKNNHTGKISAEGSIVTISPMEPEMQNLQITVPRPHSSASWWIRFGLWNRRNNHIGKILNILLVSGFILSLIGIIQFTLQFIIGIDPIMKFWSEIIAPIFYGNTFGAEVVSNPSWLVNIGGATVLRAVSLFPDPHMFSFYLGLLIPIALAIVICPTDKGGWGVKNIIQNNKILYFIFITMLLAELLTFSRGGYLGLIAGIGAVIILSWRYISFNKKMALGFFAGIFVLFMMFGNQSIVNRFLSSFNINEGSNTERMKNWSQGWEVFSDNALTGVGIGNYSVYLYPTADYRTPIYAHNLYLDIGAEMGVFALIAWLTLIGVTICQLFKLSRSANDNFTRSISLGLIGSFVWFSAHSFFDTAIYSPTVLAIFVIIISLSAMVLGDRTQKKLSDSDSMTVS